MASPITVTVRMEFAWWAKPLLIAGMLLHWRRLKLFAAKHGATVYADGREIDMHWV